MRSADAQTIRSDFFFLCFRFISFQLVIVVLSQEDSDEGEKGEKKMNLCLFDFFVSFCCIQIELK